MTSTKYENYFHFSLVEIINRSFLHLLWPLLLISTLYSWNLFLIILCHMLIGKMLFPRIKNTQLPNLISCSWFIEHSTFTANSQWFITDVFIFDFCVALTHISNLFLWYRKKQLEIYFEKETSFWLIDQQTLRVLTKMDKISLLCLLKTFRVSYY